MPRYRGLFDLVSLTCQHTAAAALSGVDGQLVSAQPESEQADLCWVG